MSRMVSALAGSLGMLLASGVTTAAQETVSFSPDAGLESKMTADYGNAKPPSGFLKFCERSPNECVQAGKSDGNTPLLSEQWRVVKLVNEDVNRTILSASDSELYGQKEFWTLPEKAGDCEDYVLLKKKRLIEQGVPASALLITVVLDERGEGHAVLTFSTEAGDYILDNRRDEILQWSASGYSFLKRQSAADPVRWIALSRQKNQTAIVASGDSGS